MANNVNRIEKTLKHLNTLTSHPRRKLTLDRMEANKKYSILTAQRTMKLNKSKKTVVRLDFDSSYVYLPKRFDQLPDSIWSEISNGDFEICRLQNCNKSIHLKFSCAKAAVTGQSHQFNTIDYLNNFIYSPSYSQEDNNEPLPQSSNFVEQPYETFENL